MAYLRSTGTLRSLGTVLATGLIGYAALWWASSGHPELQDLREWWAITLLTLAPTLALLVWRWSGAAREILRRRLIDAHTEIDRLTAQLQDQEPSLHATYDGIGMRFGSVRSDGSYEGLLITVGNFRITNRSTTRPVQVYFVLTIPYGDTRVAFDGRAYRSLFPPAPAINDFLPDTLAIAPAGSAHGTLRFFAPRSFDLDKLESVAHYLQAFDVISDHKVNVTFTHKPPLDSVLSRPPRHTFIARESDCMD